MVEEVFKDDCYSVLLDGRDEAALDLSNGRVSSQDGPLNQVQ